METVPFCLKKFNKRISTACFRQIRYNEYKFQKLHRGGSMMIYIADDVPKWTDSYKLMTKEQLNIPGLHMMGYAHFQEAYDRLDTHFHTTIEFVVIIKGRQQYIVEGKHYMLYGNEMFVTYPYEQHGNGEDAQDRCEFIWFQIDMSSSQNFLGQTSPRSEYVFHQIRNYHNRTQKVNSNDIPLLQKAFTLLGTSDISQQTLGYNYFMQFILKNICISNQETKKEVYSEDIEMAVSYIHKNLFADMDIEVIASQCGLSVSRFKSKFKEQIGVTPHSYINALKIDTAKVFLKDESKTITEIAYVLNFSSSNHFASIFKKYTGCTPSEFRNHQYSNLY